MQFVWGMTSGFLFGFAVAIFTLRRFFYERGVEDGRDELTQTIDLGDRGK